LIQILSPELQIQASYRYGMDDMYAPANLNTNNQSWAVPIRTGTEWVDQNWIQVDLLKLIKLTKIMISSPASSRGPKRIRIDYSKTGVQFTKGKVFVIQYDKTVIFGAPVVTRFLRFVVITTNDVTENLKAISLYDMRLYGCVDETIYSDMKPELKGVLMPPRIKGSQFNVRDRTISGDDVINYRHVAEDIDRNILYFCDVNPYRPGLICYSSQTGSKSSLTWLALPWYINNVIGYSPVKGRMYLQDRSGEAFMSSADGKRIDVVDPSKIAEIQDDAEFLPATVIPGYDIKTLTDLEIKPHEASQYSVGYDGITKGSQPSIRWSSCCIINDVAATEGP